MTGAAPRRFPMLPYWIALALLFVVANFPIATWAYSFYEVAAYHCDINLSVPSTCEDGGLERGQEAAGLTFSFVLLIYTWPLAFVGGIVWLIVLLGHRAVWRQKVRDA